MDDDDMDEVTVRRQAEADRPYSSAEIERVLEAATPPTEEMRARAQERYGWVEFGRSLEREESRRESVITAAQLEGLRASPVPDALAESIVRAEEAIGKIMEVGAAVERACIRQLVLDELDRHERSGHEEAASVFRDFVALLKER
jgi:hypothetical protein